MPCAWHASLYADMHAQQEGVERVIEAGMNEFIDSRDEWSACVHTALLVTAWLLARHAHAPVRLPLFIASVIMPRNYLTCSKDAGRKGTATQHRRRTSCRQQR